ncbi:hypothetical protein [Actinokineospora sp.]|uniref:hypothetical protein n=1 Tax=Actinokineospora sp. TaxID=1872133 RepID=UPI004037B09B
MRNRTMCVAGAAIAVLVAGCSPASFSQPASPTDLGTVDPAYPVGTRLGDWAVVVDRVPVSPRFLDLRKDCATIPPEVLTSAGFAPTEIDKLGTGCLFGQRDPSGSLPLRLGIGTRNASMSDEVAEHVAMAAGRGTDRVTHLAWLRIGTHYAIERVLASDPGMSCS